MGIGNRIKEFRTKLGLTQKDLADKLLVTSQAVSRWENDEVEPSIDTLRQMSKIFGCSIDELVNDEPSEKVDPVTLKEGKNEEPLPQKEEMIPVKHVIAICDNCSRAITSQEDLYLFDEEKLMRSGRSHYKQVITKKLCPECFKKFDEAQKKKLRQENEDKAAELKAKRGRTITDGVALGIFIVILSIILIANGAASAVPFIVIFGWFIFSFIGVLVLDNTFVKEMWLEVASWGVVRFPGVIFSLDFAGIRFLILVKLAFLVIGFLIGLFAAAVATVLCFIVSIVVFPFAIAKNKREINALLA